MTITETAPAGTVTRYWKTGVVIGHLSLDGITNGDPASAVPASGERCQSLPLTAVPGIAALREQLLASMNDLARADEAAPVTEIGLTVQTWRNGYDEPAFATPASYAAWVYLAASDAPAHTESGCLAFSDPRAGSAMTADARPPVRPPVHRPPCPRCLRRRPRVAHQLGDPPRTAPAHHHR